MKVGDHITVEPPSTFVYEGIITEIVPGGFVLEPCTLAYVATEARQPMKRERVALKGPVTFAYGMVICPFDGET